MPSRPLDALDPFSPEVGACPWPHLARLRDEAPIFKVPGRRLYLVTRFEDCMEVCRNTSKAFCHSRKGFNDVLVEIGYANPYDDVKAIFAEGYPHTYRTLDFADPPDHTRQRRAVIRRFFPRKIEARFRATIEQRVDALIEAIADKGQVDLIGEFAVPLVIGVISEALGVPEERSSDFKEWSDEYMSVVGQELSHEDWVRKARAHVDMQRLLMGCIESRREQPQDDLLSDLLMATEVEDEGERLSVMEVLDIIQQFVVAGNETTVQLVADLMLLLITHPDQLALLEARPELATNAVEEVLRLQSPSIGSYHFCREDVVINGTLIEAGSAVALMWGSANRDPDKFDDPLRFQVDRDAAQEHLAFGYGAHFCIGAPLARLEARVAIERLVTAMTGWQLAPDAVLDRGTSFMTQARRRLDVQFQRR